MSWIHEYANRVGSGLRGGVRDQPFAGPVPCGSIGVLGPKDQSDRLWTSQERTSSFGRRSAPGLSALRLFALRLFALSGTHEQSAATRHSAPLSQSVSDRSGLSSGGLRCAFWRPIKVSRLDTVDRSGMIWDIPKSSSFRSTFVKVEVGMVVGDTRRC